MKKIHILPTDKPSRLWIWMDELRIGNLTEQSKSLKISNQNLYITSDEEIKEGDWCHTVGTSLFNSQIGRVTKKVIEDNGRYGIVFKKIILTTDQDLIKDGVQAIDDEFLQWFVKNPSCEEVKVEDYGNLYNFRYLILIPKEELKSFSDFSDKFFGSIPKEEPKQDLEKEMFELEQELDIPSHLRWHNSKPKQETLEEAALIYSSKPRCFGTRMTFIDGAKWQEQQTIEEVFEWLTTNNYLTDLKETLIENFKNR